MAWCKVLLWRTSWHGDQDTVREERHQGGDIPLWVTPALPCFYDQVYFLTFNHWMHLWLNPPMSMSPYDPPKILCMSLWGDILDLNHNSDLRDIAQIWIFLKSMDCPTLLLILFEILYHFFFFCYDWFSSVWFGLILICLMIWVAKAARGIMAAVADFLLFCFEVLYHYHCRFLIYTVLFCLVLSSYK